MLRVAGLMLGVMAFAACSSTGGAEPADGGADAALVCRPTPGKLDVLFMLDNSTEGGPMQNSLIEYFPDFLTRLQGDSAPLDLHVGVVTSDLGAGRFTNVPSCTVGGDQGMLQNTQRHPTKCGTNAGQGRLVDPTARFLAYAVDPSGGPPATNFVGELADAFACYADVGDQGCGFEQPLASVQAALDGCTTDGGCTQAVNAGFLRSDAVLAIILMTDEDDSSTPPDTDLWDPSDTSVTSVLGPLTSYRQFEFGNVCDGQPPGRKAGPRDNCVPGSWDSDPTHQQLMPELFALSFKALTSHPRLVYVGLISGPAGPITVTVDAKDGYPFLEPACQGGTIGADWTPMAATHLAQLVSLFDADRASFTNLCQQNLAPAMQRIGADLATVLASPCP